MEFDDRYSKPTPKTIFVLWLSLIFRFRAKMCVFFYLNTFELSMNATVEQLAPVEQQATNNWVVVALYQFKEVSDAADLQQRLLNLVKSINLCGTLDLQV